MPLDDPAEHLAALIEHARRVLAMNQQATLTRQELEQLIEAIDTLLAT